MDSIKHIHVAIPEHVYFHFKHKCSFFELSRSDVLVTLIEKFIDGDFDTDFGLEGFLHEGRRDTDTSDRQGK
jgi:hypothetical protein